MQRNYSFADRILLVIDNFIKLDKVEDLQYPKTDTPVQSDDTLSATEARQSAKIMRVNHSGELCAQALYYGQALFCDSDTKFDYLLHAADEERVHLGWCKQRLNELNARASLLAPAWYLSSVALGAMVSLSGDSLSFGFIDETEKQVVVHLTDNINRLPVNDHKSRTILLQMRADEAEHANAAVAHGAKPLPTIAKLAMAQAASVFKLIASRL